VLSQSPMIADYQEQIGEIGERLNAMRGYL
jgi:hypothetical protein